VVLDTVRSSNLADKANSEDNGYSRHLECINRRSKPSQRCGTTAYSYPATDDLSRRWDLYYPAPRDEPPRNARTRRPRRRHPRANYRLGEEVVVEDTPQGRIPLETLCNRYGVRRLRTTDVRGHPRTPHRRILWYQTASVGSCGRKYKYFRHLYQKKPLQLIHSYLL